MNADITQKRPDPVPADAEVKLLTLNIPTKAQIRLRPVSPVAVTRLVEFAAEKQSLCASVLVVGAGLRLQELIAEATTKTVLSVISGCPQAV